MHVEFARILENALSQCCPGAALSRSAGAGRQAMLLQILEVDDCPDYVERGVTTSIAFKAAKVLNEARRAEDVPQIGPQELATELRGYFSTVEPGFQIEIGGGGHLNARPTPEYSLRLLNAMVAAPVSTFLSPRSFFEGGDADPQVVVVDWSACMDRIERKRDSELMELTAGKDAKSLDPERKLMLLGVLADPEIDPRPFLSGLKGNQNLPWLMQRFADDVVRFIERGSFPKESLEKNVIGSIPPLAESLAEALLHFRRSFFWGAVTGKPEQIVAELLALVRGFYRIFHHPRYRDLSSQSIARADAYAYAQLALLSLRLIEAALASFALKELLRMGSIEFNGNLDRQAV
ncbi:MAG: hypothetical protein U0136_05855 [Bdellovibrionota bacterium]